MITVNNLINELIKLKDKGYGDLPVVYSSDDEGNSYKKVNNLPDKFLVEDINQWELDTMFEYDENDELIDFTPNCIIIN